MSNRPRRNATTPERPATKRQRAYQSREAQVQRNVLIALGGAVLLAIVLIVGGVLYDRLLVPGRTIKTVNGQTLSRGDYDRITRETTIQQLAQNLQFARILGPNASFGQDQSGSFQQQVVTLNSELAEIGSIRGQQQPVNDQTVDQWVDARIVEQGAQAQFQINPSQGEVDQVLVERMGSLLATPEPLTSTTTVTPTPGLDSTVTADATSAAGTTAEPDATSAAEASAVATPTTGPTSTPAPTGTPTPSPVPEEASTKAEQIVGILYDEYTAILEDLPDGAGSSVYRTPHASKADIAAALRAQYRNELIQTRVKQQLVPTVNPDDTTVPEQINARHILLKVPAPTPTPTPTPTGSAEATATADETATADVVESPTPEPSPTPTLEPAALDALFAERKAEADAIYEQVRANPESFAEVARENSEDEGSAAQGGDLGTFGRGQMVAAFEEAAFALKENEISPPVRSEFGWHIIQRLPEDPAAKLERQQTAAYDAWLADLRSKATVIPAPTATPTEVPTPTEMTTEVAPVEGTAEAAPMEGTAEVAPQETATAP